MPLINSIIEFIVITLLRLSVVGAALCLYIIVRLDLIDYNAPDYVLYSWLIFSIISALIVEWKFTKTLIKDFRVLEKENEKD